jgi:hypothetical protein
VTSCSTNQGIRIVIYIFTATDNWAADETNLKTGGIKNQSNRGKMKYKTLTTIVIAVCVTLSTVSLTSVSAKELPKPTPAPSLSAANLIAYFPTSRTSLALDGSDSGSSNGVGKLLGLADWLQCWNFANYSWVISSFQAPVAKRTMSIQCGSQTSHGYLHIALGKSGHQSGWRNRIFQANPAMNTDSWDDLMWMAAKDSWSDKAFTMNVGSGKVCRSAPIEMYGRNPDGSITLKYTFRPTFIWSMTDNRLITAIPSSSPTC